MNEMIASGSVVVHPLHTQYCGAVSCMHVCRNICRLRMLVCEPNPFQFHTWQATILQLQAHTPNPSLVALTTSSSELLLLPPEKYPRRWPKLRRSEPVLWRGCGRPAQVGCCRPLLRLSPQQRYPHRPIHSRALWICSHWWRNRPLPAPNNPPRAQVGCCRPLLRLSPQQHYRHRHIRSRALWICSHWWRNRPLPAANNRPRAQDGCCRQQLLNQGGALWRCSR